MLPNRGIKPTVSFSFFTFPNKKGTTFNFLVDYLTQFEETPSRLAKIELVKELLTKSKEEDIDLLTYLASGTIDPATVGEPLIIKAISKATKETEDKIKNMLIKHGDLGLVTEVLLNEKKSLSKNLVISDIYAIIDCIRNASGKGCVARKIELMRILLTSSSPLEGKWIIRIIEGNLRTGVSAPTFLQAISELLNVDRSSVDQDYYFSAENLGLISKSVKTGKLPNFEIQIGTPISMMKAERVACQEDITKKIELPAVAEYKLDGFRGQIHKQDDEVKIFSRSLEEVTEAFPDVVKEIVQKHKGKNYIVEGEICAIDENNNLLPFQKVSERIKRKHKISKYVKEIPVKVYLFDCLFYNNESFLKLFQDERFMYLKELTSNCKILESVKFELIQKESQIELFMNTALNNGAEGIIVKRLEGTYQIGSRTYDWIKWKSSYKEGAIDTLDLVVIGGEWGTGKRVGKYSSLLLASYEPETNSFTMVGNVGTGFKDDDLDSFNEMFDPIKHYNGISPDPTVKISEKCSDVVWFSPIIVMEVLYDEISQNSTDLGYGVRFPRFIRFRPDKKAQQATTSQELKTLYEKQVKQK